MVNAKTESRGQDPGDPKAEERMAKVQDAASAVETIGKEIAPVENRP